MRELVRRIEPVMRHAARYATRGGPVDGRHAPDLVHGAWERLTENDWRRLRRFDPERGTLESYAALMVRQTVSEVSRSLPARTEHHPLDPRDRTPHGGPGPEHHTVGRDLLVKLNGRLTERLSPRTRLVFALRYEDGHTDAEIAEQLGVPMQTVYNATATIRRVAREILEELEDA